MSFERVLVRAPNWLGDTVLSLPALRDLRRNFPAARLEVLARPAVAEVYRAVVEVDSVRETSTVGADGAALRGAFDLGLLGGVLLSRDARGPGSPRDGGA